MAEQKASEPHTTPQDVHQEDDHRSIQTAVDFLLRSRHNGMFFRTETAAYMIPIQRNLGYKISHLRVN